MKPIKYLSVFLILFQLSLCLQLMSVAAAEVSPDFDQIFQSKEYITASGEKLNYRIFLPQDYNKDKKYPVLLFMHGYGQRGNDNNSQLTLGIKEAFKDSQSPVWNSIVIAPQCPMGEKWVNVYSFQNPEYFIESCPESKATKRVVELLGFIKQNYSTDENRYYVTGLSMGGFATWDLIVRHPNLFAAAVPLCGGADNEKAMRLVNMPIWTFHGDMDDIVPMYGTQKMVEALKNLGSTKVKFTVVKGGNHYIQDTVYSDMEMFKWLYSQNKALRPIYNIDAEVSSTPSYQSSATSSVNSPASSSSVSSGKPTSSPNATTSSKTTTTIGSTSSKNTVASSQSAVSSEPDVSKESEITYTTGSEVDNSVSSENSSEKPKRNGGIIVVVCSVAAVLVIGAIITLVIFKLKKK